MQTKTHGQGMLAMAGRDGRGLGAVLLGLAALLTVIATIAAGTLRASAHEHREVGEYEFTVGFMGEPALLGEPNGLDLRIQQGHGDGGTPVEGLEETLEATIQYGDQSMPLELRAVWNTPGAYTADVIPSAAGAYTFHVTGTINGTAIDETFTSGPETFSEVEDVTGITFPATVAEDGDEDNTAEDAKSSANTALTLAIVALALGVVGMGLGAGAMKKSRSDRA